VHSPSPLQHRSPGAPPGWRAAAGDGSLARRASVKAAGGARAAQSPMTRAFALRCERSLRLRRGRIRAFDRAGRRDEIEGLMLAEAGGFVCSLLSGKPLFAPNCYLSIYLFFCAHTRFSAHVSSTNSTFNQSPSKKQKNKNQKKYRSHIPGSDELREEYEQVRQYLVENLDRILEEEECDAADAAAGDDEMADTGAYNNAAGGSAAAADDDSGAALYEEVSRFEEEMLASLVNDFEQMMGIRDQDMQPAAAELGQQAAVDGNGAVAVGSQPLPSPSQHTPPPANPPTRQQPNQHLYHQPQLQESNNFAGSSNREPCKEDRSSPF
jgi:hypothetical protein